MRKRSAYKAVLRSFAAGKFGVNGVAGFRLTQFAVLGNHIHLMVEADSREQLVAAMTGLTTRIARALNKVWNRTGTVFSDRYHDEVLDNPSRVRNALNYILHNGRKHGIAGLERWFDPCSSTRWFDGFDDADPDHHWPEFLARAETWLLIKGWRIRGLLTLVPALPPPELLVGLRSQRPSPSPGHVPLTSSPSPDQGPRQTERCVRPSATRDRVPRSADRLAWTSIATV